MQLNIYPHVIYYVDVSSIQRGTPEKPLGYVFGKDGVENEGLLNSAYLEFVRMQNPSHKPPGSKYLLIYFSLDFELDNFIIQRNTEYEDNTNL